MPTDPPARESVSAAVERAVGAAKALVTDAVITLVEGGSTDMRAWNEYFRLSAQIAVFKAAIRTELEAIAEAARHEASSEAAEGRVAALEKMLKVYASGHHDDHHVGRGAEDYTDCPERICIDACTALGWTTIPEPAEGRRMQGPRWITEELNGHHRGEHPESLQCESWHCTPLP